MGLVTHDDVTDVAYRNFASSGFAALKLSLANYGTRPRCSPSIDSKAVVRTIPKIADQSLRVHRVAPSLHSVCKTCPCAPISATQSDVRKSWLLCKDWIPS